MSQLTVIAKLKAKSGAEDKLFEECRKLIAPSLADEGCINYDMFRSVEDPGTINVDNYGKGWLFEFAGDVADTLDVDGYHAHLEAGWEATQRMLKGQVNKMEDDE